MPALSLVISVVEKRQTLPILANLYMALQEGVLTLVGTDLEVEIAETLRGVEGEDGICTVTSRKLFDICRMLPENAEISFRKEQDNMLVKSGRSRFTLKTLPAEEFPRIETDNWEERIRIDRLQFKQLLDKTSFSMATQDVRYYLNGVMLELDDKKLTAVATDGHRLSQSEMKLGITINNERQIIVPRKAVQEINRFLEAGEEEEITLEINRNQVKLTRGETILITKLLEGKYPEYKSILETELQHTLLLERLPLLNMLSRAAVLTNDRFRGVRMDVEDDVMTVNAHNPEHEEAEDRIAVDYQGEKIEAGFNVTYMIEALRVIPSDFVELSIQDNDSICYLQKPGDDKSLWLIMPMRL